MPVEIPQENVARLHATWRKSPTFVVNVVAQVKRMTTATALHRAIFH